MCVTGGFFRREAHPARRSYTTARSSILPLASMSSGHSIWTCLPGVDGQQLRVGEPETDSLLLVAAVPRITGPFAVQRRHGGGDIEPAGSVPTWSSACPLTRLRRGQMLWSCWTMLDRANRRKPPLARCRQARTA